MSTFLFLTLLVPILGIFVFNFHKYPISKAFMWLKFTAFLGIFISLGFCIQKSKESKKTYKIQYSIESIADIKMLFPKTVIEVTACSRQAINQAEFALEKILSVPNEQRTYKNTIKAFDKALIHLTQAHSICQALTLISPNEDLLREAQEATVLLDQKIIELFSHNKALYEALQDYYARNAKNVSLAPSDHYFIQEVLKDFQRRGLNRDEKTCQKIMALEKELAQSSYNHNIYKSNPTIMVSREELAGLDDAFIDNLKKTNDKKYILGTDAPTVSKVLSFCNVSSTRKKLFYSANSRAYPENEEVLQEMIQKRHALAQQIGFESFAHLSLESEMVKNPEYAQKFLKELMEKVQEKAIIEFKKLTQELPVSVELSNEGKLHPWDKAYLIESYKKKHFDVDENLITHYFPMEKTIQELLAIYQEFFGLQFKQEPIEGMWHPDIKCISVYDSKQCLGYLLLDLHPRKGKYNNACHANIIPAMIVKGQVQPALSLVIANFPPSTDSQPSLLKRENVITFFHEFAHALHALLGATQLGMCSGTRVKKDFVEMPSQMLEQWLWNPAILKRVSCHYQTGEQLPDEIIEKLLTVKNLWSANDLLMQIFYSLLSLNFFSSNRVDLYNQYQKLYEMVRINDQFPPDTHFYTSFGHLTGYGAKYYCYLWSKVFALDLFDHIKKQGLLNPVIGRTYKDKVLAPGGSKDPYELIENFLGRAPNQDAFLKDIGL